MVAPKDSDRGWHKEFTMVVSGDSQSVHDSEHVDIDGEVGLFLSKGRQDTCHVHHIVDVVLFNKFTVRLTIFFKDTELLIAAGEVEPLLSCICGNNIFSANFFTESVNQGDSDLPLASSDQYLALFPGLVGVDLLVRREKSFDNILIKALQHDWVVSF